MARQSQVIDLRAGKGMTVAQSNEHLRVAKDGAYSQNISVNFDPSREHLNFEITKGGVVSPVNKKVSIPRRIKQSLKKRGIKDPNEKFTNKQDREKNGRRTVANFILEGSRETMRQLAFGNQQVNWKKGADNSMITREEGIEKWAQDMYRFIAEKYGEENIAAFVVHLDETTPHVHCTVLPVSQQNKLSWKQVFHGESKESYRKYVTSLHDELAAVNEKYGLQRGESTRKTGARHRTTEEYREWLDSIMEENRKTVDEQQETIARQEKVISENKSDLYRLNDQIKQATKKVRSLNSMIANLEEEKKHVEENSREYKELNEKIAERREQLAEAEDELQRLAGQKKELKDSIESMKTRYDELQRAVRNDSAKLENKVLEDMQATGWRIASEDAKGNKKKIEELRQSLSPSQQNIFDEIWDGSIMEAMSEKANEIVVVSTALFLGYIDSAVSFANSHGGGGGSPGGGWGRKKDDDDDMWRRKCFFMGIHMMRPKQRKIKR